MIPVVPRGWSASSFGELFQLKLGYAFKGRFFSESGPYVVLTPGNFFDEGGFRHKDQEKYYTGEVPNGFILKRGDLIVAMTEQKHGLLGSTAIVPDDNLYLHNQRLGLVVDLNTGRSDKKFLYYLFNTHLVRAQIQATANGAKVRHTSPSRIYEVKMSLPPLNVQQQIAAILSAYDDLIENNLRRIKILEEMAQNLYREWFVKFRFPGHEQVRMVDSPLGKIPEGWEATTIGAVTSYINRGVAPKYDDSSESLVINQRCIRDRKLNMALARKHKSRVMDKKYVEFGDVLINSIGVGTLGRVTQVYEKLDDVTVDTHVSIVRPSSAGDIDYLGVALIELESYFESLGAGATGQTELRRDRIGETELVFPATALRRQSSEEVSPNRQLALNLAARNRVLRQTRDLLLPKLIAGELDVSHLDIELKEQAA